jgi:hypothetical protein
VTLEVEKLLGVEDVLIGTPGAAVQIYLAFGATLLRLAPNSQAAEELIEPSALIVEAVRCPGHWLVALY